MIFLTLFYQFFYIGLFTVGGGLAIIPFLEQLVNEAHWLNRDDLSNIIALAEITPGAVGVNMATYTGYALSGIGGSLMATLGLITPSLIIVGIVGRIWTRAQQFPVAVSAFNAAKAAVVGLLASVFITLFLLIFEEKGAFVFDWRKALLFVATLGVAAYFKVNAILYIIALGIIGAVIGL